MSSPASSILKPADESKRDDDILPGNDAPFVPTNEPPKSDASQYLVPPQYRPPHRPLSPDTLSNLSAEEFDQLGPRNDEPTVWSDGGLQASKLPKLSRWQKRLLSMWHRNLGLFYMLLAQIFGVLMNVTTRLLEIEGNKGKGLHPFQILFARMSITVLLASVYMWYTKTPHFPLGKPEVRWLLVARGVGGFWGVFGMYYSLLYLPLSDATVITFLAPSLTCWVCSILLKEAFTRIDRIGSLVSFVGVIFIARPASLFASSPEAPPASGNTDMIPGTNSTTGIPDASNYDNVTPAQRLEAVGIALIGVFGSVIAYTTIRWIGKRAHPLISVNYFATWCTIVSTGAQFAMPSVGFLLPADLKEWGYLIFLGTCGFIMQFLLAAGLSYEKSSRATNMAYTSMLFALGFDRFFFGQTPGIWSIIGSTLILGSAIYMAMQRDNGSPKERSGGVEAGQNTDEEERLMEVEDADEEGRDIHMRILR